MVGAFRHTKSPSDARSEALRVLDSLGLSHLSGKVAGSLTVSARKQMEIARALATKPELLLLDEPVGGLNPAEVDEMMSQVIKIRDSGITIFIIEHVMKAIMSVSDRIAVLHHGEKIAENSPRDISANRDVITAYLGEEYLAS
jgi:branched-chain amino acid transport system ATP-binding protein